MNDIQYAELNKKFERVLAKAMARSIIKRFFYERDRLAFMYGREYALDILLNTSEFERLASAPLFHNGDIDKPKKPELKDNEFRCRMCNGIFEKDWSDAEAVAEAESNGFDPLEAPDNYGMVCDDCYKKTPWGKANEDFKGQIQ